MQAAANKTAAVSDQISLKPSDYVHLHNHTHHSLLDGLTKVDELVDSVKKLGMEAVAITDHGTLSGAIEFYKECKNNGIKPIIGIEAYVAARSHSDKEPHKDKSRYHIILLAMNNVGYKNLLKLSTTAHLEGMYYKPRIDHELLERFNEGIIVLSACASGEIGEHLRNDDYAKAKSIANWYKKIFKDRYYFEIQDHNEWDVQRKINNYLFKLSNELQIKCVVSSDAHYLKSDDLQAHEILLCVGTAAYLSDQNRMSLSDFHLHVTDPAEIINRWGDKYPEVISNTKEIADRCNVELDLGGILIPTFPTPGNESEKSYLHKLVWRGLAWRYGGIEKSEAEKLSEKDAQATLNKQVSDRTIFELGVIDSMGFNGYFLIIWDFINWGKNQGIIFGPGRGSAAGSIIAYGLNITDLDPLKYDLLFERFLNPDRISMPDIDIDIQDSRRDEVITYCVEKYGSQRVANIVTFGKMAARAAIRDVARVLQVPYIEADRLAKLIPPPVQGRHIPLYESIKKDPDLKKEYRTNSTSRKVIDYAIRLEGTIRSHGVHAAGVVIAPDDIVNYAPLEMAQKGVVATQYPMGPIEELGLLKMDFLGLSNLTIINNAIRIVRKVYKKDIDLSTLPLDDAATYKLFQKGDTTGVFQLESAGMKRYLRDLKPTKFEDIIAMVALYRPGPMQFIGDFIKRKHGQQEITYLHPKMKDALSNTYGILVYQEQFMQISKDVSGFSGGQADTLRKAVGKKKIDLMRKVKKDFVEGGISHSNVERELMEQFWDQLEEFANYCFNKSHAACYGLIAYWTAYLKAHYPDAFMAALMTSDQDDIDRLSIEISECRHMGINVLPPDVNQSFVEFGVVAGKHSIRFGMAAIKGVGTSAVDEILRARKEGGDFNNIEDFASRVSPRFVNRKALEALIKAGAFDEMADRSDLYFNIENIIAYSQKISKDNKSGQQDLFGSLIGDSTDGAVPRIHLDQPPSRQTDNVILKWERELLGLYLSAHPLDVCEEYLHEQTIPLDELSSNMDELMVTVGGVINSIRTITTKSGSKMAFLKLEDRLSEIEVIVFPKVFEKVSNKLIQDTLIKVVGKINARDRDGQMLSEIKILAEDIQFLTDEVIKSYIPTGMKYQYSPQKPKGKRVSKSVQKPTTDGNEKKNDNAKHTHVALNNKVSSEKTSMVTKKIYVHVKDPGDHEKLIKLKQFFNRFPGLNEIVLVLGSEKRSAVKLPFKTELNDELQALITSLYGEECVAIR